MPHLNVGIGRSGFAHSLNPPKPLSSGNISHTWIGGRVMDPHRPDPPSFLGESLWKRQKEEKDKSVKY